MNDDPRQGATSASNAAADERCPGRHLAQKGLPEQASAAADFGITIHAALAANDPSGLTTEQADIYESCLKIEAKLIERVFGLSLGVRRFIEKRLWITVPNTEFKHSGQADRIHRLGSRGLIVDFKSLAGDVPESPENQQLRDLVVLAAENLILGEVTVALIQPLVTHEPLLCIYDKAAILQAREEMFERIRKSNNPKSLRIAGDVQCKFCLAKPNCREHAAWSAAMLPARIALPDLPVAEWTVEQRVAFCEGVGAVERWIEDNKDAMKALLQADPESIPGFYLKPGATRELITDPETLYGRFSELGGKLEQFMTCVSITKGKFQDQVKAVTGKNGQALKAELKTLLDGIVEQKQNAPSLAKKK